MNPIFNELDHRLSVVKRWGILHTIQNQSVAEHVHNVVRIAHRIAVRWFDIKTPEDLFVLMLYAHKHDDLESLSGDIPTMAKPYFDEAAMEEDHADLLSGTRINPPKWVRDIVKLADKLEGFHFLCIERQLGNAYCQAHIENYYQEMQNFISSAWTGDTRSKIEKLAAELMEDMAQEKSTRFSRRGR